MIIQHRNHAFEEERGNRKNQRETFTTENIERTERKSIAWKCAENDFSTAQSAKREP